MKSNRVMIKLLQLHVDDVYFLEEVIRIRGRHGFDVIIIIDVRK